MRSMAKNQTFKVKDGAYVREHFLQYPELKALVADWTGRSGLVAEPRQAHIFRFSASERRRASRPADLDPRQDDQGLAWVRPAKG